MDHCHYFQTFQAFLSVSFSARDIKELKILDFRRTASEPGSDPGSAAEPSLVPAERQGQPHLHHQGTNSTAPITILRRGQSSVRGATPASQRKNTVRNGGPRTRDDECFGGGTDDNMDSDFDFEGNLALFDKAAVFSKISSLGAEGEKPRYRHDQNILEVKPIVYRQITVPQHQHGGKEYCT
ncbi:enhancer of mRNA-decapping protein 3-like, partial [Pseudochaenichthys georgianus]|uniref:enhancer of mRNA-decapping protein 3-like n=1 Tax=Pseudochaenichthys georgianus TaxID=52239 RepID=UPI00146DAF3D